MFLAGSFYEQRSIFQVKLFRKEQKTVLEQGKLPATIIYYIQKWFGSTFFFQNLFIILHLLIIKAIFNQEIRLRDPTRCYYCEFTIYINIELRAGFYLFEVSFKY